MTARFRLITNKKWGYGAFCIKDSILNFYYSFQADIGSSKKVKIKFIKHKFGAVIYDIERDFNINNIKDEFRDELIELIKVHIPDLYSEIKGESTLEDNLNKLQDLLSNIINSNS